MLKAICVVSANDCCVAMSEHLAGSEEAFVQKMNKRAEELGMKDTVFKNCHGIDEDDHLTSSYDIALMSKELLNNHPDVTKYTTIWMDSLRNGESELVNTNKLIRTYEGATGLKTGSTSLALYNARTLLDYGFSSYEFLPTSTKDEIVQNVAVGKGIKTNVNLVYENSTGSIIKKGNKSNLTNEIKINENISAPINKGDILGKVDFYLNDELISSSNLVAEESIKKMNSLNMFEYVSTHWSRLLR